MDNVVEATGLTRYILYRMERGEALPTTENLLKLSRAYDVDIDFLLKPLIYKHPIDHEFAELTNKVKHLRKNSHIWDMLKIFVDSVLEHEENDRRKKADLIG